MPNLSKYEWERGTIVIPTAARSWTGAPSLAEPLGTRTLRFARPLYTMVPLRHVAFMGGSKQIAPHRHKPRARHACTRGSAVPLRDTARFVDAWTDRWVTTYAFVSRRKPS